MTAVNVLRTPGIDRDLALAASGARNRECQTVSAHVPHEQRHIEICNESLAEIQPCPHIPNASTTASSSRPATVR